MNRLLMMGVGVEMAKRIDGQNNDPEDTLFLSLTGNEVMLITLGLSFVNAFGEMDTTELVDKISQAIDEQKGGDQTPIRLDEMRVETVNLGDIEGFDLTDFLNKTFENEEDEPEE